MPREAGLSQVRQDATQAEEAGDLELPNPYQSPQVTAAPETGGESITPTTAVRLAGAFVWISCAFLALPLLIGLVIWLSHALFAGGGVGMLFIFGREFHPLPAIFLVLAASFAAACQYWAVIHGDVLCSKITSTMLLAAAVIGAWNSLNFEQLSSSSSVVSTTVGYLRWSALAWCVACVIFGLVMARWAGRMRRLQREKRQQALDQIRGLSDD